MALSASALKALIKSKVDAVDVDNGEKANDEVLQAIADAIVEHITSDATVIVTSGSSAGSYRVT